MLNTVFMLLVVACAMVAAHEAGHALLTRALGGRFLGIHVRGFLVGVRLSVKTLSTRQVAWTLAAGPFAEILVVLAAIVISPKNIHWWLLILALQWIGNLTPWGLIPNDGTRLWQLWRRGAIDLTS